MRGLGSTLPEEFNIVEELLERHVEGQPDSPAIGTVSEKTFKVVQTLSYSELGVQTNRLCNALRDSGIMPEQRVAIMLNDGVEFASTFLAGLKIGAVPVLLSTYLDEAQLLHVLNDSRARILFVDSDYLERVESIAKRLTRKPLMVSTGLSDGRAEDFRHFMASKSTRAPMERTSKNDVAFWYMTSGSTGNPKAVVHLHHDIFYAGRALYDEWWHMRKEDVFFSSAKLYFSAGMGFGLYGPLLTGASTLLYPGKSSAEASLRVMTECQPTAFIGVPTIYGQMLRLLQDPKGGGFDLSSVRLFAAGGEPLPPDLYLRWKERVGVDITDGLGSAEVCHYFTCNIPGEGRPGSCGLMLPGYLARVVDDDMREVPPGEMGLLLVKGESSFVGYWHMHELTKKTILGDWVNTGDLVYIDREGYVYVCGRADQCFKIHGLWVSPFEIETLLIKSGDVAECCVVPATGADGIAEPIALVVLKDPRADREEAEAKIIAAARGQLSSYKVPKRIVIVDALPLTTVGKVDRAKIIAEVAKGHLL